MREKQLKLVLTFHTTTDAMAMEQRCMALGLPGRLIPLPTVISADCGMCWAAPPEAEKELLCLPHAGEYYLLL